MLFKNINFWFIQFDVPVGICLRLYDVLTNNVHSDALNDRKMSCTTIQNFK